MNLKKLFLIFYALNNNFSYTQISFDFLLQKDFYSDPDDTSTLFLYLLQKDFCICLWPFFAFFFFRKILVPCRCFLLKLFFVLLIIFINDFYICTQKNYKILSLIFRQISLYFSNNSSSFLKKDINSVSSKSFLYAVYFGRKTHKGLIFLSSL